jgi:mono/diheme cytochrome c family protein
MKTNVRTSRVVLWFVAGAMGSLLLSGSVSPIQAAAPAPNQAVDPVFERQVKPILAANCVRCHSGRKIKGGIDLSARDKLLLGGDSGPSVVAGKPADSLLVEVLGAGGKPHMPPKKQLPPAAIAVVSNWIGGLKPGDIPTGANQQATPNNGGKNKKHGKHEKERHRGRRERDDD